MPRLLLHRERISPKNLETVLVDKLVSEVSSMFPDVKTNADHTGIVNSAHFDRLEGLVRDALDKGAKVTVVTRRSTSPFLVIDDWSYIGYASTIGGSQ